MVDKENLHLPQPPAFPIVVPMDDGGTGFHFGMTLRDYFAGQVIATIWDDAEKEEPFFDMARVAYGVADAMLEVRDADSR